MSREAAKLSSKKSLTFYFLPFTQSAYGMDC